MRGLIFLFALASVLYIFSPQSGIVGNPSVDVDSARVLSVSIKDRTLGDPTEAELKGKVGEKLILQVTTDEDGRVDLKSVERATFNPVFSGTINSISVPTDKEGSYQVEFHPQARPGEETSGLVISTVIIER